MRNIYDLLNMDLQALTDTNHQIASTYTAIITKIIDHCKGDMGKVKKVRISNPNLDGNMVTVKIKYG